jgi:ATP adenylyltransferase
LGCTLGRNLASSATPWEPAASTLRYCPRAGIGSNRAAVLGEQCGQWAQRALDARGPESLRSIMGLCNLIKKHSGAVLNAACAKALKAGTHRLKDVRRLIGAQYEQSAFSFAQSPRQTDKKKRQYAIAMKDCNLTTGAYNRMGMSNSHHFQTKYAFENFGDFRDLWDKPIFESQSFFTLPTVGALLEGWLLVLPKFPTLSFANISTKQFDELETFLEKIIPKLWGNYGPVALFEHGPSARGSALGCGVDYAHLHLVPTDIDLHEGARRLLPNIHWEPVKELREIRQFFDSPGGYWFVQQTFGSDPCFVGRCTEGLPLNQLFRRVIANGIGRPEAYDWKVELGVKNISATVHALTQPKIFHESDITSRR